GDSGLGGAVLLAARQRCVSLPPAVFFFLLDPPLPPPPPWGGGGGGGGLLLLKPEPDVAGVGDLVAPLAVLRSSPCIDDERALVLPVDVPVDTRHPGVDLSE